MARCVGPGITRVAGQGWRGWGGGGRDVTCVAKVGGAGPVVDSELVSHLLAVLVRQRVLAASRYLHNHTCREKITTRSADTARDQFSWAVSEFRNPFIQCIGDGNECIIKIRWLSTRKGENLGFSVTSRGDWKVKSSGLKKKFQSMSDVRWRASRQFIRVYSPRVVQHFVTGLTWVIGVLLPGDGAVFPLAGQVGRAGGDLFRGHLAGPVVGIPDAGVAVLRSLCKRCWGQTIIDTSLFTLNS